MSRVGSRACGHQMEFSVVLSGHVTGYQHPGIFFSSFIN